MKSLKEAYYSVIIDTDTYSGNFEREMCAYVTGRIGDCGMGDEIAKEAIKGISKKTFDYCQSNVISRSDEHGCYRPVAIAPTPGWSNDGMGKHTQVKSDKDIKYPAYQSVEIFLYDLPSKEIFEELTKRIHSFVSLPRKEDEVHLPKSCMPSKILNIRVVKTKIVEERETVEIA